MPLETPAEQPAPVEPPAREREPVQVPERERVPAGYRAGYLTWPSVLFDLAPDTIADPVVLD